MTQTYWKDTWIYYYYTLPTKLQSSYLFLNIIILISKTYLHVHINYANNNNNLI